MAKGDYLATLRWRQKRDARTVEVYWDMRHSTHDLWREIARTNLRVIIARMRDARDQFRVADGDAQTAATAAGR